MHMMGAEVELLFPSYSVIRLACPAELASCYSLKDCREMACSATETALTPCPCYSKPSESLGDQETPGIGIRLVCKGLVVTEGGKESLHKG